MKTIDIRPLTDDQLKDEILKLKKEQFNLRFQKASGQLENTAQVRQVRRDIARSTDGRNQRAGRQSEVKRRVEEMPKRILQGVVVSDKNDEDHRRVGRTPAHPSGAEEDRSAHDEVSCA